MFSGKKRKYGAAWFELYSWDLVFEKAVQTLQQQGDLLYLESMTKEEGRCAKGCSFKLIFRFSSQTFRHHKYISVYASIYIFCLLTVSINNANNSYCCEDFLITLTALTAAVEARWTAFTNATYSIWPEATSTPEYKLCQNESSFVICESLQCQWWLHVYTICFNTFVPVCWTSFELLVLSCLITCSTLTWMWHFTLWERYQKLHTNESSH